MNKSELVAAVALASNVSKKDTEAVVKSLFETIEKAMADGDKVQLIGFGTFETRDRAAREGRNPRNGQTVKIPSCKLPVFKAGKALKDAVNK